MRVGKRVRTHNIQRQRRIGRSAPVKKARESVSNSVPNKTQHSLLPASPFPGAPVLLQWLVHWDGSPSLDVADSGSGQQQLCPFSVSEFGRPPPDCLASTWRRTRACQTMAERGNQTLKRWRKQTPQRWVASLGLLRPTLECGTSSNRTLILEPHQPSLQVLHPCLRIISEGGVIGVALIFRAALNSMRLMDQVVAPVSHQTLNLIHADPLVVDLFLQGLRRLLRSRKEDEIVEEGRQNQTAHTQKRRASTPQAAASSSSKGCIRKNTFNISGMALTQAGHSKPPSAPILPCSRALLHVFRQYFDPR